MPDNSPIAPASLQELEKEIHSVAELVARGTLSKEIRDFLKSSDLIKYWQKILKDYCGIPEFLSLPIVFFISQLLIFTIDKRILPPIMRGTRKVVGKFFENSKIPAWVINSMLRPLRDEEFRKKIVAFLQENKTEQSLEFYEGYSIEKQLLVRNVELSADIHRQLEKLEQSFRRFSLPIMHRITPDKTPRYGHKFYFWSGTVTFRGRTDEMKVLEQFMGLGEVGGLEEKGNTEADTATFPMFAWGLIWGKAGTGKSRLALELGKKAFGLWYCGFFPITRIDNTFNPQAWRPTVPTLFIIDYVSTAEAEKLRNFVEELALASEEYDVPVRVLLVEREGPHKINVPTQDGAESTYLPPWYKTFCRGRVAELKNIILPLENMAEDNLWQIIQEQSGKNAADASKADCLSQLRHIDPDMTPLFAVFYGELLKNGSPERIPQNRKEFLDSILQRERYSYWRQVETGSTLLFALSTILGERLNDEALSHALTKEEYGIVRAVLPSEMNFGYPLLWLKTHQPHAWKIFGDTKDKRQARLKSLKPDILGEYFVYDELYEKHTTRLATTAMKMAWDIDGQAAMDFVKRMLADMKGGDYNLAPLLPLIPITGGNAMYVCDGDAEIIFEKYMASDSIERSLQWKKYAERHRQTAKPGQPPSVCAWLEEVFREKARKGDAMGQKEKFPDIVPLDESTTERLKRLCALADDEDAAIAVHKAKALRDLSARLMAHGKRLEALFPINAAANLLEPFARTDDKAVLRVYAKILEQQADICDKNARFDEAIKAARQATDIQRSLNGLGNNGENLASSLYVLTKCLRSNQEFLVALKSSQDVLDIRRGQAKVPTESNRQALAEALQLHSSVLWDNNRFSESLEGAQEAMTIMSNLWDSNPDRHAELYAKCLHSYATDLDENHKPRKSIRYYNKALKLRKRLAEKNWKAHANSLAATLNNIAGSLNSLNKFTMARKCRLEALRIRHRLVQLHPEVFALDFIISLGQRSIDFYTRDASRAIPFRSSALSLARAMASYNPEVYMPQLVKELRNMANLLAMATEHGDPIALCEKAIEHARELVKVNSSAHNPLLASALVSYVLNAKDSEACVAHANEAVDIYRAMKRTAPFSWGAQLASTLYLLAEALYKIPELDDALDTVTESIQLYTELDIEQPGKHTAMLDAAKSLQSRLTVHMAVAPPPPDEWGYQTTVDTDPGEDYQAMPEEWKQAALATRLVHVGIAQGIAPETLLEPAKEAVRLCRQLVLSGHEGAYAEYCSCLNLLGHVYQFAGENRKSLTIQRATLRKLRRLVEKTPTATNQAGLVRALISVAQSILALAVNCYTASEKNDSRQKFQELYDEGFKLHLEAQELFYDLSVQKQQNYFLLHVSILEMSANYYYLDNDTENIGTERYQELIRALRQKGSWDDALYPMILVTSLHKLSLMMQSDHPDLAFSYCREALQICRDFQANINEKLVKSIEELHEKLQPTMTE